jgi:hypothetical protein
VQERRATQRIVFSSSDEDDRAAEDSTNSAGPASPSPSPELDTSTPQPQQQHQQHQSPLPRTLRERLAAARSAASRAHMHIDSTLPPAPRSGVTAAAAAAAAAPVSRPIPNTHARLSDSHHHGTARRSGVLGRRVTAGSGSTHLGKRPRLPDGLRRQRLCACDIF